MELIATARFKKALDRALEAEAYTRKIAELAADLSAAATTITHPLLAKARARQEVPVACHRLQPRSVWRLQRRASSARRVNAFDRLENEGVELQLELSGKRPIAFFRFQGVKADKTFTHFEDKPRFDEVEELADRYIADFISGKVDRVEVAYMKFVNAARQAPVVETLLPLSTVAPEMRTRAGRCDRKKAAGRV